MDKPATAKPSGEIATVELNGKLIATGVFMNGLVSVPVRQFAEKLGAKVSWNGSFAVVNGRPIIGSRLVGALTHAPVREVAEAAGYRVSAWDGQKRTVTIQK